jgi:predicted transposase YdaD
VALRYRIVRVWRTSPEQWLKGGLGLVPLAPLGDLQQQGLPAVIARMKQRLGRDAPPRLAADLWSAAYILMGLRYDQAVVQKLLQGVVTMRESVTYQAIIEEGKAEGLTEGRIEEARTILLLQGRSRFGEPSPEELAAVHALTDVRKLERLSLRLLEATSWSELLGLNGVGRRGRRRKRTS